MSSPYCVKTQGSFICPYPAPHCETCDPWALKNSSGIYPGHPFEHPYSGDHAAGDIVLHIPLSQPKRKVKCPKCGEEFEV